LFDVDVISEKLHLHFLGEQAYSKLDRVKTIGTRGNFNAVKFVVVWSSETSNFLHFNVKLICALRQILNCLYRVLDFELVKELSVQQPLGYGTLYLQTSSELPLY